MELHKMNPETAKMLKEQKKLLTSPTLDDLQEQIEELCKERDRIFLSLTMTKEQIISLFNSRGYYPNPGDKFWKIKCPFKKGRGLYGWQVGQYEHSCHVDDTTLIVLLIIESATGTTYVMDYADMWLDGPIVV